ncbi:MAG: ankyrin repeat domain-containing protein [Planctomycetota bacterium]
MSSKGDDPIPQDNNDNGNPYPPAYEEGFLRQDYDRVVASLNEDPNQAKLSFGIRNTTLLHAAAYDGKADIVKLLLALGANVNARHTNGRTPLHLAANKGYLDVIEILVRNGADIEAKDEEGMTPLMWGIISRSARNDQIVSLLLSLGAKNIQVLPP